MKHTPESVRVLVRDIGVAAAILERKGFPMNALCVRTAIERLSDLLAENERMREALQWFVDDIDGTHTSMVDFSANVARARAALTPESKE